MFKWFSRRRKSNEAENAPLPDAPTLYESGARLPADIETAREPTPDYIPETEEPPEELWQREQDLYRDKQEDQ